MLHDLLSLIGRVGLRVETWILLALVIPLLRASWRRSRAGRSIRVGGIVALAAVTFLPIGEWALHPVETRLERPQDPGPFQGLIILGGAEDFMRSDQWATLEYQDSSERVMGAIALARRYPHLRIVVAGGGARSLGGAHFSSEAQITVAALTSSGVAADRILIEDQSRNTMENARYSHALVSPQEGEKWLLVTSAFHMPRALKAFETSGWTSISPYPVDHRSLPPGQGIGPDLPEHLRTLNLVVKEALGSLAYALLYPDPDAPAASKRDHP